MLIEKLVYHEIGEGFHIGRIINVTPNDDYTLLIEFEQGNQILFNMQRIIKTIPYNALNDLERFKNVKVEDKALCWYDMGTPGQTLMPVRLTIDNILFAIRD
ncbi:MAG: DUF2442 domain-containing protein [Bacillota bacterium]|nr:DUF2442 domain-containing protein [Bacillota bacterium]